MPAIKPHAGFWNSLPPKQHRIGELADIEGVAEAYSVTGEWDFVAIVRVPDHEQLADVVTSAITGLSGVTRTQTMVAFAAYSRHDLEALFAIGE